ncbi:MAG: hypothetical protein AB7H90_05275 [Alphaproteobacteria bacterium]
MAEFADLRAQVPIERVFTEMLGVTDFQKCGPRQMIGTCPLCGARALKITPAIGMGNCFNKACKMGGGVVKVVSLARKLSFSDAGDAIAAHFGIESSPKPAKTGTAAPPFDPVAYQTKLDPDAEQLASLGIASGIIREFGGGYCAKGRLGGYLALPLHEGTQITSFFGVSLDGVEIKFGRDEDRHAIFNASGLEAGEPLTVVRDPLAVLRAAENGDNQVIAVFTAYTPDALRRIAAVMAANKIEECELF